MVTLYRGEVKWLLYRKSLDFATVEIKLQYTRLLRD